MWHMIGDRQYLIIGAGESELLTITPLPMATDQPVWLLSPHGCSCPEFIKEMLRTGKGKCEHHDWLLCMLREGGDA